MSDCTIKLSGGIWMAVRKGTIHFRSVDKTMVERWLEAQDVTVKVKDHVVVWEVEEEYGDELIDVFGPFTEREALEWATKVKTGPKYADAMLRIMKLADPTKLL